jgi:monoamine oxidase
VAEVDYCVVGAGFAGLAAALRLKQAGRSVALLEARDRVGGRTFTVTRPDRTWIDRGGAWVGPGQDRVYALMHECRSRAWTALTSVPEAISKLA